MAIERNFRVPDGLVLCYPALNLSKHTFTPSLLLAIDDPILPYSFLNMCLESYIGDYRGNERCDPRNQFYLSQGIAPDHLLSRFPRTRIMVPTNDPIRDESFKFTLRLAKLGVDVFLKEYMYMPHGFLNFNAPILGMKDEANETISQCISWMAEMITDVKTAAQPI